LKNPFSKVLRVLETVRHLSAEQWAYRFINRGERIVRARFPRATFREVRRFAEMLPEPRLDSPTLGKIVEVVHLLHSSIHGDHIAGVSEGRFTFLNRTVDFGSIEGVDWRRDLGEGNNRLWLMNLAYFGWSVPFVEREGASGLAQVAHMVSGLEAQNGFEIKGVFGDVWNAYTASHRLISLIACLATFERIYGTPDVSVKRTIIQHIVFCAAYVRKSLEKDLQYNHLLKNYVALTVFSASCGGDGRIFPFLERAVIKSVRQQVLVDGGHSERSPMYNVLSYLDLSILSRSGIHSSWSFLEDEIIPKMALALKVQSHPDGDIALFNDSWLGEAPSVAAVVGRERPANEKVTLLATGYTKLSDDSGSALVFDHGLCGPDDNPGHAHADFLSVEISIKGERFIVDPGTPTYSTGALRDLSRSASQHNGPSFEGLEPIDFWSSFRIGRRGRGRLVSSGALSTGDELHVAGAHDGYSFVRSDVARQVVLFPGVGALVVDIWRGPADGAQSRFLVGSSWAPQSSHRFRGQSEVVDCSALIGALSSVEAASYWPRFAAGATASTFTLTPSCHDGLRVAAVWFGWAGKCPVGAEEAMGIAQSLAAACQAIVRQGTNA
jgi:hypothetical protein